MSKKETIVTDIINNKISQFIDQFTEQEFLDEVGDKIFDETHENLDEEEVKFIIQKKLNPLLVKFGEYVVTQQM
jgi:hypothetical protein